MASLKPSRHTLLLPGRDHAELSGSPSFRQDGKNWPVRRMAWPARTATLRSARAGACPRGGAKPPNLRLAGWLFGSAFARPIVFPRRSTGDRHAVVQQWLAFVFRYPGRKTAEHFPDRF
ncbi:hypothetical protein [Mesorhizobium captivum]|uniref:hypothetical protein n=1 Tax=Mesorhizobium captivum TaxID=3072319 RepID=UPI002A23A5AE|nr:hypothetical protein [Mesorhizobium sp. VK23E]MDX8512491.1 hypothetical protein [Mesorhizobium sp. VK23E]